MLRFIKMIFNKTIFMNKDKCNTCLYLKSVSNWSPCYECERNNKYEPCERLDDNNEN